MSTATYAPSRVYEREPLFLRLEPDRLPLLRPFEPERDFALVRLRPLLDEPLPLDELLLRLDLLPLDLLPLDLLLDPLLLRLEADRPPELDAEDFDLRDAELRLRELDDERCFFTSPSSIVPRQAPSSSSFIIT
jgi:hypothetical protein